MKQVSDTTNIYVLREITICRRLRTEDACLLTVRADYPRLIPCEVDTAAALSLSPSAAMRMNDCYQSVAEAFVAGGIEHIGARMRMAYDALEAHEKHGFKPRELCCRMSPSLESPRVLRVRIVRFFGVRRSKENIPVEITVHRWQLPAGFLLPSTPKSKKS